MRACALVCACVYVCECVCVLCVCARISCPYVGQKPEATQSQRITRPPHLHTARSGPLAAGCLWCATPLGARYCLSLSSLSLSLSLSLRPIFFLLLFPLFVVSRLFQPTIVVLIFFLTLLFAHTHSLPFRLLLSSLSLPPPSHFPFHSLPFPSALISFSFPLINLSPPLSSPFPSHSHLLVPFPPLSSTFPLLSHLLFLSALISFPFHSHLLVLQGPPMASDEELRHAVLESHFAIE